MALTVVQAETILLKRTSKLLTALSMDGTTVTGDNPDLVDPMGYAIRQMGGTVATITDVIDADLAGITDYDKFLDLAELRTLQNAYGNFALIDVSIGPRDEKWSSLGALLDKMITRKEDRIKELYGLGLQPLVAGVITLDFAEHDEDNVDEDGW